MGVCASGAVWGYYSHLVLVLMVFALAFMSSFDSELLHGLIVADGKDVESLRNELRELRGGVTELKALPEAK